MVKVKLKINNFLRRSYGTSLQDFKGFAGIRINGKMTLLRGLFGKEYA